MFDIILGRSPSDQKKYGKKGTVFIGKQYVQMGQTSSLSNAIYLDVARAHAMLICGKRGCLTEDTLIFTNKGYKKIKDFDEKKDLVLSFNKEKFIFEWEKSQLLSYNISKNELLKKIILDDGQELILTQEHPLLINRDNKVQWIIAEEIKKTDTIVSIYNLKYDVKNKNKESLRIARLLGFLLADGNLYEKKGEFIDSRGYKYNGRRARLRIINGEDSVLKQAKKDLDTEFNIKSKIFKKENENCYIVETNQQKIVDKFIKLGLNLGKKHDKIKVPEIVWCGSKKFKKEFLKALFSCDGYVAKGGSRINYYSNSKKIIQELNLLLSEFGIHSKLRIKNVSCNGKKFSSYELDISDYTSVKNFMSIGFYQEKKNNRLDSRKFNKSVNRKKLKYFSEELFAQKIKEIEDINGIKEVFDLRVPKNHSFIANGVISHNSGKSYTMGSIAEGLADLDPDIAKNLAFVLMDTMGVYWSMKYPNNKEDSLLKKWGIEGKGLDVQIFVPGGFYNKYKEDGIPVDFPFYIKPMELSVEDWMNAFELDTDNPVAVVIQRVIGEMINSGKNFSIDEVIENIENYKRAEEKIKYAAINRFENCKNWGIFSSKGTPIKDILTGGKVSVMDLSPYVAMPGGWQVKALVLGLISKRIFVERMLTRKREELFDIVNKTQVVKQEEVKEDMPMPWLIVDECLPYDSKIFTNKGLRMIGDIVKTENKENLKVLGYDENKKDFDFYKITKVYDKGKKNLIKLKTSSNSILRCTPDHKVYSKEGFVEAIHAKSLGFLLEKGSKKELVFEDIVEIKKDKEENVFDISVEKVHNFIAENVLVHNCHEFLPESGETPASKALMTILREGRQPGVSLIMATQQPAKIHTDAITQSDIVMSHRLTASFDLEALDKIFLSYDSKGSKAIFNTMPRVKGCAILMDDKNERLHTVQIKPRFTWHGGEDPNAIREVEDKFDF